MLHIIYDWYIWGRERLVLYLGMSGVYNIYYTYASYSILISTIDGR